MTSINHEGNSLLVSIMNVVAQVTRYLARGRFAIDAHHTASLTDETGNSNKSLSGSFIERRGINLFL